MMAELPDFETFCDEVLDEPISKAWATHYDVYEGRDLDAEGVEFYTLCTGRFPYTPRIYTENCGLMGRRSEKTQTALKYLMWKILFAGWEKQLRASWFSKLARHTRLLRVPIIAQDTRISRDIISTAAALGLNSSIVSKEIIEVRVNEIIFRNGISMIGLPASKASVRGMTCPAALLDELAWVSIEGADDRELVRQVRPSMIQFGQSRRLLKFSTPWQSSGVMFTEYSERASRPNLLVWQASTQKMTPRIAAEDLERERLADPVYFTREYLAQFTSDIDAFIPSTDVDAAIGNWRELAPAKDCFYVAALDASGLTGGDKFTFGIAHSAARGVVVDVLRGWRRESVAAVCDEIASVCKTFSVRYVIADQYSFSFLAELMRQRGIELEQLAFSARSKAEIYFDLKGQLAQGKFLLPQHAEMVRELRALESTRLSGGSYRICAPKGQNDDFVTVLALLANKVKRSVTREPWVEVLHVGAGVQPGTDFYSRLGPNDPGPSRWWQKLS
jgi:hypothetical protein